MAPSRGQRLGPDGIFTAMKGGDCVACPVPIRYGDQVVRDGVLRDGLVKHAECPGQMCLTCGQKDPQEFCPDCGDRYVHPEE